MSCLLFTVENFSKKKVQYVKKTDKKLLVSGIADVSIPVTFNYDSKTSAMGTPISSPIWI